MSRVPTALYISEQHLPRELDPQVATRSVSAPRRGHYDHVFTLPRTHCLGSFVFFCHKLTRRYDRFATAITHKILSAVVASLQLNLISSASLQHKPIFIIGRRVARNAILSRVGARIGRSTFQNVAGAVPCRSLSRLHDSRTRLRISLLLWTFIHAFNCIYSPI